MIRPKVTPTWKLERFGRRLLISIGLIVLGLILTVAGLHISLLRRTPPSPVMTDTQIEFLKLSPWPLFCAARRYEELPQTHILRQLPRYQAIALLSFHFRLAPEAYAKTLARHVPFRIKHGHSDCAAGLEKAAQLHFKSSVADIPMDGFKRLIRYAEKPMKFPLVTSSHTTLSEDEKREMRRNDDALTEAAFDP
ncbi:hypothetical protein SAMN02745166_02064 [Prosthecobacter debontii]|uniref:Uncharacterized protein n=1 Tax=Prosthecobacter debontii TaxID=48467 RepID=A0A1T4XUL8_9BACT|nr:hypothetical protein [Prosthecobacter debontii]SKA93269.1 hypothetical protein SAMN02745166_02064 [Prosthecobacter debontii]